MKPATALFRAALLGTSTLWISSGLIQPAFATPCAQDRDCNALAGQISWCHQDECVAATRDRMACRHSQVSPYCIVDANCEDGQPDSVNWCESYRCHRAPRNQGGQCQASPCSRDPECNDFDFSTQDWCHQGRCVHARKNQLDCRRVGVSCSARADCLDGDRNTVDWCFEGSCAQANRASNGSCAASSCTPTTIVLESTRRGAVNNPILQDRWKVIGSSYQIRYQRGQSGNFARTLSYHCFDLAAIQGRILSAELEMVHSDNSYESQDPSETVVFRPMERVRCDEALDVSVLRTPPNHQAIFDDLNDGAVLAQFTATLSDNDQTERFPVTAAGLTQLRNLAGQSTPWGIGGGLSTANAPDRGEIERVFRGTDDTGGTTLPAAKLILQVRPAGCP